MDINNLLALDSNKQNYPKINLPSDAKYYVSAEEYNVLIKALQSWITDYNAKVQALEDSVYRLPIVTVDSAEPLSDENILSSTRTLLEIIKELAKLDDKFLSKLTPDTAEGKITFKEGLDIGSNQKGAIDSYGNAELNSLKLRQWLEVPELRFNRVEVQMGDKWRSPGGGIVESVDTANKIITLKLTDGEIGAVAKGDLCVGIFHSMINENNATADVDDSRNNRSIKGFATCYFKVEEITETARNSKFRYSLREESGNYPKQISPEAFMNFAVFGNRSNTSRQSSVFESRTYQRFLINVSDWEINKVNVAAQFGNLSNLTDLGISGMSAYSAYLSNVYFSGTIFQVKPPIMKDGTWWEWDNNLKNYVDTGVKVSHPGKSGFHHTLLNQSLTILRESSYFSHTWAELHVYEGSKELTYVTTTPTLPATYAVTLEASGVSPGNLYIGTGTTPFAKTTPIQAMPGDTGSLKFNISGIGSDNKAFSFTTNQTFVKVNSGIDGKPGENGKDGKDIEYVFTRTRTSMAPDIPQTTEALPSGWTANSVGVDDEWEYEWYVKRVRIDGVWGPWYNLQEWRHHVADGHHGKDGATREYIYIVNNDPNFNVEANRPINSPFNDDDDKDDYIPLNWSDDPTNPGPEQQYEWYCYRDKTGGEGNGATPGTWGPWQGPYLWSRYGKDGKDGDKGDPGIDGSSAPLLYLSASSQIMTCFTSNVPHPGQIIKLEAKTQNIVINDLSFQAMAYWVDPEMGQQAETVSLIQPGTDKRERHLTTALWDPKYEKVTITAHLGYLNDDVTIHRLADPVEGSSAVVGFLTNGNITFTGFSDGPIINRGTDPGGQYVNGHGEFWVYEGLQRKTTGVEFSVVSTKNCSVIFLPHKAEAYRIEDYVVNDFDSASAVLQAEYHGVVIKQVLTISVSRRGKVGQPGTNVPIVYRGVYSPTATYYGNSARVDVVKIESPSVAYYRTDINTETIQGISPLNSSNVWVSFGANFESVATDLLLAERANIGGFVFYKDQIISQYGKYITSGNTVNFSNVPEANISDWYPNIVLDGLGGELVINSATVRGNIEAEKGKIGGWLIGANTFTSQLASYINGPTTPIDSGNLSYIQVTFWNANGYKWEDTYTYSDYNKYMKIRYGDQAWPESTINFKETGPDKVTNIYEKHLQYEFGISSGSNALTTFPTAWYSYPAGLTSPLSNGSYLWIRQRSYQNIDGKPTVIGLWSKPFRVSPVIKDKAISPNISLNGADGTAIFSGGKVQFNSNGSGHIANRNISWDAAGNAEYKGTLIASGIGTDLTKTVIDKSGIKIFNANGDMNIRFGMKDGHAVMEYYNNLGNLLYDLGPNGITMMDLGESKWIPIPNMLYLGTDYSTILTASPQKYKNPTIYPTVTLYQFQCARLNELLSGTPEEMEHDGLVFMADLHSANKANGIYVKYDGEPMQMTSEGTNQVLTGLPMQHTNNEIVFDRGIVNMVSFRRYSSGTEYREVQAYWNT